jgi:hypothetical protein
MSRILALALVWWVPCAVVWGQTNILSAPVPALPCLTLKTQAESKPNTSVISLPATTNSFTGLSLWPPSDNAAEPAIAMPDLPLATNHCPLSAAPGFPLLPAPERRLLQLPLRPEDVGQPPLPDLGAVSLHSSAEENPYRAALLDRMEEHAGLLKPPGPVYDSEIDRAMAAAFRREVIRVGNVQFSCSIITAIARKNPFCLLDSSFLQISF